MKLGLRIIPITMAAATLLVTVKLGEVWHGITDLFGVGAAEAQQTAPAADPSARPRPAATGAPTGLLNTAQRQQPAQPAPPVPATSPPATSPVAAVPPPPIPTPPASAPAGSEPQNRLVQVAATPVPAKSEPPAPAAAPAPGPLTVRDPSSFTRSELELLQNLAERRDVLDARARDIEMRESLLAAAEQRVAERIAELKRIEARIEGLLKQHDEQDEQSLRSLVKVYENMKPKDAARIFEQLDMGVLLDVVERMRESKVAPILADMDPTKAKSVTTELATKRQLPTRAEKNG